MQIIEVMVNLVIHQIIQVIKVTIIVKKEIGKIKSVLVDAMTKRYISSISLTTITI